MPEVDPLIFSYSHLADFPRAADALHTLKKVASLVKPLMRARGWKVGQLTEFYPNQPNLLGLNVDRGTRICLRLRYPGDRSQFLPLEQVADTMLHELAHNVHGPHDAKFHALWNQLRDEHLSLTLKGYTGEGFLSEGHRLGGGTIPMDEARRLARIAAEKRRTLGSGSGQRLGGAAPQPGQDIRKVIGDAVERRNRTLRGCANDNQTQDEIVEIANTATRNGFKTQADEDAANDAAIAQALWEIVQEEETAKKGSAYMPLGAAANTHSGSDRVTARESHQGLRVTAQSPTTQRSLQDEGARATWTCGICTLNNPANYLCCDVCGTERTERPTMHQRRVIDLTGSDRRDTNRQVRPPSEDAIKRTKESRPQTASQLAPLASPPWTCHFCGRVRESQWWSCDLCGTIKLSSN
ncbi:WLM-domain-containing protein [Xylaria bambusicola]|uniref:WLM-domain-containing protein n=1 Tax=Xylaria bambusicola TaxID=326684 RepID=UPI00200723E3|nr:WLM-domain-containing protein [Xylaria bambusicola]KAI0506923.1 WLM-domain-containing protein [Xylaria bambusicola]